MIKVLVCGGRDYRDYHTVAAWLHDIHLTDGISMIIQGGANGADEMAGDWAKLMAIPCLRVPADWQEHGKRAGYLRNAKMLEYKPDLVLAFPGGRGTNMMIDLAKKAGVKIVQPGS